MYLVANSPAMIEILEKTGFDVLKERRASVNRKKLSGISGAEEPTRTYPDMRFSGILSRMERSKEKKHPDEPKLVVFGTPWDTPFESAVHAMSGDALLFFDSRGLSHPLTEETLKPMFRTTSSTRFSGAARAAAAFSAGKTGFPVVFRAAAAFDAENGTGKEGAPETVFPCVVGTILDLMLFRRNDDEVESAMKCAVEIFKTSDGNGAETMAGYLSGVLSKMADSADGTRESLERVERCLLLVVEFCGENGVEVPGLVAEIAIRLGDESDETGDGGRIPPL